MENAITPTVLLVDDNEEVRDLARDILEMSGFYVHSARSCSEAIRLFEAHSDQISLLISDIVMPTMSGRDLARILRNADPSLPILFTSGYLDNETKTNSNVAFIAKPFTPATLIEATKALLSLQQAQ